MEKKSTTKKKTSKTAISQDYGKLPPQNLEIEAAVLGALMLENDAFGRINEIIRDEEYFYSEKHQKIFRAIKSLAAENKSIDYLTVAERLRAQGTLEEVGDEYAVGQLTENIATTAHIEDHADTVAKKFLAREMIRISSEIQRDAFDPAKDVEELMQEAEGKIFDVTQTNHKKDVLSIAEIMPEAIKRIEEASKSDGLLTGVPSGFHRLDKVTSGWQPSDLVIIAARPAMGKTAFTLTMAKNIAMAQIPVAFFSLEMSNVQLVNRLLVNASELSGDKIKRGKLSDYEFGELNKGMAKIENIPLYIDDTPSLSVIEFRTKARRLVSEKGVKLIIIDYLQLMNASGMSFGNREGEVSIISRSLKAMAKELNIPIIALSQLNRNVESRGGGQGDNKLEAKKPQLSDLRESGAIEQDADIVCFIHRPDYYKITEDPVTGKSLEGVGQIIIAKHRNGATGDVDLFFAQDYAMFVNTKEEYEILKAKAKDSGTQTIASRSNNRQAESADYPQLQTADIVPNDQNDGYPF